MNGVILVAVVHIIVEVFVECGGLHLAVRIRDGDDLMFRELHGAGLMHVDMAAAYADHTLILVKHRVYGSGIGLCAACQEEYLRIGQSAGFADAAFGPF